jgi:hypothetical protein
MKALKVSGHSKRRIQERRGIFDASVCTNTNQFLPYGTICFIFSPFSSPLLP